jgi:transcriptional regulator with PAS, ATPase and Fis domain
MGTNIKGLSDEAAECFYSYHWPGNVRELENMIERLMVLCDADYIELKELPPHISNLYQVREGIRDHSLLNLTENGEIATLEEYEREILKYALKRFGSYNAAGKALGIDHKTVALKAKKYNIINDITCES